MDLHDGADYSPYEGMKVNGWPVTTIIAGKIMVDDGVLTGSKGQGRYCPTKTGPTNDITNARKDIQ